MNEEHPQFHLVKMEVAKSRDKQLVQLFGSGVGIHHAGMLRADRGLTERLFLMDWDSAVRSKGWWMARSGHADFWTCW
ncbi:putative DNA helicase [Helianthus annuus]|nr:putative DNA helicase [Helianthus annuus]